jgi:hypothetical protein
MPMIIGATERAPAIRLSLVRDTGLPPVTRIRDGSTCTGAPVTAALPCEQAVSGRIITE